MGYGGSCMYMMNTSCGYPLITVSASDVDVIYAYNKTYWITPQDMPTTNSGWDFIEKV